MKSRVLFVPKGKSESVKEIAQAIAQGAKITCDPIEKHTTASELDVLFLGGELSFGKISGEMHKFAMSIDPSQVKEVAVFTVTNSHHKSGLEEFKTILEPKGIKVSDKEFCCTEKVTDKELKEAHQFGADIMAAAGQ